VSRRGAAVVAAFRMPPGFYAKLDEESPSHTTYLPTYLISVNLIDRPKEATFEVSQVAREGLSETTASSTSLTDSDPIALAPPRPPGRSKSHPVQARCFHGCQMNFV